MKTAIGFMRLADDAIIPTKAHATDAGYDLYASKDVIIEPGATEVIPTGIALVLPAGYEAQVRPRSGVTAKTKLRVNLGTIDADYRGEIGVIVDNIHSGRYPSGAVYRHGFNIDGTKTRDTEYYGAHVIRKGDRIAQLVINKLPDVEAVEVFTLDETPRGTYGFGSSGFRAEVSG